MAEILFWIGIAIAAVMLGIIVGYRYDHFWEGVCESWHRDGQLWGPAVLFLMHIVVGIFCVVML